MTDLATTGTLGQWPTAAGMPAQATVTGLALPDDLTFDEWAALGRPLLGAVRSSMWWIGDWILAGEQRWGQTYTTAIELTGLDYGTLRNAVMVCRALPLSRRHDEVPFWHHYLVVTGVELEAEWDGWLAEAARHQWSHRELRARLRDARALPVSSTEERPVPRPVRVPFPPAVVGAGVAGLERVLRLVGDDLPVGEREALGALVEGLRAAAEKAAAA